MGIPSFFAQLVRTHGNCLRKIRNATAPDYMFLDANSIIYDCVHKLCKDYDQFPSDNEFVAALLQEVLKSILDYKDTIQPSQMFYVAFDGNPPAAKLYQQRSRRHKSALVAEVARSVDSNITPKWDTTQITPGTCFMEKLMSYLDNKLECTTDGCKIVLDPSSIAGEGEHKIFQFLRDNLETIGHQSSIVIYGLDADLIMLSLNHLHLYPNINLYRETPIFIAQIDSDLDPEELYAIDIHSLSLAIQYEMGSSVPNETLVKDYILLCFLLGNDFIPHTPSVCIRTNGLSVIFAAYSACLKRNKGFSLTSNNTIQWRNMRLLFTELKKEERDRIKEEIKSRRQIQKRTECNLGSFDPMKRLDMIPMYERCQEEYVDPSAYGWSERYYEELCGISNEKDVRKICIKYFEALEWTFAYYSSGCKDWGWTYDYHYAPLFEDLARFVSYFNMEYIPCVPPKPITTLAQLCIVLPKNSRHFLPEKGRKIMEEHYGHITANPKLVWAFCRYLWEAQVNFDSINVQELEALLSTG